MVAAGAVASVGAAQAETVAAARLNTARVNAALRIENPLSIERGRV
jgi:hypothetical protein